MIDTLKQRPLQLSHDGNGGVSLSLPVSQVDRVRELLDREGVRYWRSDWSISFNGKPATTVIYFSYKNDPTRIQAILDRDP